LALVAVSEEALYARRGEPLYRVHPVLFLHDEIIAEVPEVTAHEAATRISEVMVETMRLFTPDVRVAAPPALMRRWHKAADPVYVDGRLVPWEPTP
jgi:DNA polymerase I-like protein with 3'-5' exonuclease and polymerase domains